MKMRTHMKMRSKMRMRHFLANLKDDPKTVSVKVKGGEDKFKVGETNLSLKKLGGYQAEKSGNVKEGFTPNLQQRQVKQKTNIPYVDVTLPPTQVYYQAWVKYYHYNNATRYPKPPSLFQNNAYFHQRIKVDKLDEKDKYGSLHIPGKALFYMAVYNNSIGFYSNRDRIVFHQIDSMNIHDIKPIPEDGLTSGGIQSMGDFPFGSCIEIAADIPKKFQDPNNNNPVGTNDVTWIICMDTRQRRMKLMQILIKLKIRQQRLENKGQKILKKTPKPKPKGIGGLLKDPMKQRKGQSVEKPVDGYWILLQDWTGCSVKCGGGLKYQQWMCVPPKKGGAPCKGEAVRTIPCNTQPCPAPVKLITLMDKRKSYVAPLPQVKVGPFSTKPQRYSKCLIKENDAYVYDKDDVGQEMKRPIRLVMNNQTVSIFKDEDYEDLAWTFKLKETQYQADDDWCCFHLQDLHKNIKLCGYDSNCGKKRENTWVDKWRYDFDLFKTKCHVGFEDVKISNLDEDGLKANLNNDLGAAEMDRMQAMAKKQKQNLLKMDERQYKQKTKKIQDQGLTVLNKEVGLEDMIAKEAEEKEKQDYMAMETLINIEKKKSECLDKNFEEKEMDEEFEESKMDAINEQNEIKEQTNQKIKEGRWKLRLKLKKMALKAKLKKNAMGQQLQMLRSKMARRLILANKEGSQSKCAKGVKDMAYRDEYCNAAFTTDWYLNDKCKQKDEFCYTCCEQEFGVNYMRARDSCYSMCDGKDKKKKPEFVKPNETIKKKDLPKDDGGKWEWAKKTYDDPNAAKSGTNGD